MFLMNIEKENLLKIEFNSKKKGNNKETYKVVTRGSIYTCKNRIGNYYLKCYNCFSWLRRKGGEEKKKRKKRGIDRLNLLLSTKSQSSDMYFLFSGQAVDQAREKRAGISLLSRRRGE